MVYLVFLIAFSSCFAADYNQDAYEYLRKHPRTETQFHSFHTWNEHEYEVIPIQSSGFPQKVVGIDNQHDILHVGLGRPETLFSKMIRLIKQY